MVKQVWERSSYLPQSYREYLQVHHERLPVTIGTVRLLRSSLLFERRLPHLSLLLLAKGVQLFPKLRAVVGKNRDGEQSGVYGAGFANGQRADGNAGGHLHG